jgi:hypothetical protein
VSLLISSRVRAACLGDRPALAQAVADAAAVSRRRAPAGDDASADAKHAAYLAYLDSRAAAGLRARAPSPYTARAFGLD